MESTSSAHDPAGANAGSELEAAAVLGSRLVGGLRLPSGFHASIGAAVAVQVGTAAFGLARPVGSSSTQTVLDVAVMVLGLVVFGGVAALQLWRFRSRNGVWVAGLASRAVLGTANLSSAAYAASLAAATWAALAGAWWLMALMAVAGGVGYAWSGRRWWTAYQQDPVAHAAAEATSWLVVLVVLAVVGLAALVAGGL